MKDYYKILGVEEEASEEEIHARWIELTKHYHPDLMKTEEGDEKIREINEAYEILKDEPARFHYDFERDLKRSFIKKANRHRHERRMNVRKIVIPSGVAVLFLVVGFVILILRSGGVATLTGTEVKTEVLHKIDKVSGKMTASRTPPVETRSKAQREGKAPRETKEVVIPPESKKGVMPPESTEMASLRPPPSPSEVERESEQKKELVQNILLEPKVPARVEKEPPAKRELKGKLAPQVVLKSEMPAVKEVSKEGPKGTPKPVAKEIPKEVIEEAPKQVAREVSKEVPREVPKEAPPREVPKEIVKEVSKEGPKGTPKPVAKEIPKEVTEEAPKQVAREVSNEVPREVPKEVPPKEVPKEIVKEVAKEVPEEVPREVPREVPKEVTKEIRKEAPRETPIQVAREIPKEPSKETAKEVAREVPREAPKEVSTVTFHPGEHLTMWTKGGRLISSQTSLLAKEEEVKKFFSNYVARYNQKDVGGFLSFFSSRAIQNRTDRSEAIRDFYAKFFNQSQDLRYQIEGMKIEISQHRVDVRARFRVDQKLKKDGEEKAWKGNIRWVLVKEGGRLKISSLDYQNEKSP